MAPRGRGRLEKVGERNESRNEREEETWMEDVSWNLFYYTFLPRVGSHDKLGVDLIFSSHDSTREGCHSEMDCGCAY